MSLYVWSGGDMMQKKVAIPIIIAAIMMSFIAGSAFTYQTHQIQARESLAYRNPVIIDVYRRVQDN